MNNHCTSLQVLHSMMTIKVLDENTSLHNAAKILYTHYLKQSYNKIGSNLDYILSDFLFALLGGTTNSVNEPPCGKTNNVVSDQVRHKPTCTVTEKS